MNIKYATSEMGFEGYFPVNYPNLRVLETQLLYLEAYHLPLQKILDEGKTYKGSLMYNIGKGGFEKPYISGLYHNYHNVVSLLQEKFEKVYIYQDGEIGWWNQVDTRLQAWWYNQLRAANGILVPNSTDVSFYKGLFPDKEIKVIRSVMTDEGLDKTKFKPQENRTIVTGPLTREYNGFSQVLIAHNADMPIDIPPMGESRMPKDSWEMAENVGVNYLEYMMWKEWIENISQYKYGYFLVPYIGAGTFPLNCAYHGIPCIGDKRADTQKLLFPKLSIDHLDLEQAIKLTEKLSTDEEFYTEVSTYAKEVYKKEFSKEKFLEIIQYDY